MNQIDRSRDYNQLMMMHSKKSSELAPQNPLFQLNYAVHLHRTNQLADAEHYYQKAIGYDPDLLDAQFNLGSLYYFKQRYTDALSHFLTIADKNPRYKDIYHWIASIYMIQNKVDKAIELFDTLDPSFNSAVLLDTQFRVNMAAKNWEKLIQIYEQYQGLYGHAEALHNFYIKALVQTQLRDNIIRAYQSLVEFLAQFPDNTLAQTQLSQIKPFIPNATLKTL
jgi:tetratricopeptide (TPR) repeat protein